MMISTRGRYALRVLVDLAEHADGGYIPMKAVAARQEISLKYIEKIMPVLTANGFVEGQHGKGGGYRLKKDPARCSVGEILRLTEGTLAPVACLEENAAACERCESCRTFPLWERFNKLTNDYFDSVSVKDLMRENEDAKKAE